MTTSVSPNYSGHFKGARCLITGGAGFIGSHLSRRLLELGADVVVLDDFSSGHQSNLAQGVELRRASVTDEAAVADAVKGCRYVFHQAAMVSVPQSVEQPGRCVDVNIRGTQIVLSAARDAGVKRVMFAASAAAYGNTPSLPSKETDLPDCWSPYAASKIAGELLLASYARNFGLSTISLRYFNVFGPMQDPKSPYAAVISAFTDAMIAGRTPRIMGDGGQTRDFVPVANIVHANLLAASCPKPLAGEVVNIGCGGRISLIEVLETMARILHTELKIDFAPPRAGDVRHSSADITRARDLLGYQPVMGFEEGLRLTLNWARTAGGPAKVPAAAPAGR